MNPIRILLVDDHPLLRAGVRALLELEPDMSVVAEADSGEEGVERAAALLPDVVLMDLAMPGMGGVEAIRRIVTAAGDTRVLVLTMHPEDQFLIAALDAGASGYLLKEDSERQLMEAIRTVAAGKAYIHPSGVRLLARGRQEACAVASTGDPLTLLSEREREVLRATVEGYTSVEIGERLGISPKTVHTYRQRLMEKLELRHRSELVHFALKRGIAFGEAPVEGGVFA